MDIDRDHGRLLSFSPTQPLRICKQAKSTNATHTQQQLNTDNLLPHKHTRFPPRTSSLPRHLQPDAYADPSHREKSHNRQYSNNSSTVRSTLSSGEVFDNPFVYSPSTARSTVSSLKEHHLSDSSKIIGDFVPLRSNSAAMAFPAPNIEHSKSFSNA